MAFTREDVADHNGELIGHAHRLGIAIEGATGAGGKAPKLPLGEDEAGAFYLNTATENTDNHGRNTAILKRDGIIHLAPAFDLAPMVLDREAVARSIVWPKHFHQQRGVNYADIIKRLAHDPKAATKTLMGRVGTLAEFRARAIQKGHPESVQNSTLIHLDSFSSVADAILGPWREVRTDR